ncbi:MAG: ABC transporter ATP-binding protein [Marinilabiliaceae bacterium]|jgi:ABC-2 type transport system ATP-binding protein|nr:ABC transporter ATP-binding protein [Marinilabiliaceae bacterium]
MIEIKSVSKSYGNIVSLRDISFNIRKGEIFGLLGPNGAGKSTTVNILNTLLRPDSGEIYIDGINLFRNPGACKVIMGVVPQEIALYDNLSAFDNLIFWGSLYKVPMHDLKKRADEVLELVGLSSRKKDRIRTFSGGMKRRINIACSLLHNPRILLMDEPTAGVDPQNRNHIFDVIENLNREGRTIIYTTHYMEEAERLCDSIAIIDSGSIRAYGTLQELREISGARDIITLRLGDIKEEDLNTILKAFPYNIISSTSNILKLECDSVSNDISGIISYLEKSGAVIEGFDAHGANLESVFLRLTGKNLRD